MEIKCTVQEFKELMEKEQTECKSECSVKSPQNVLKNTISETLATDDKHKVN